MRQGNFFPTFKSWRLKAIAGWMRWGIISQSLLEKLIPWKQVLHSLCQIQNVTDNEMMVQIMSNYLINIALVNTKQHYSTSKPLNTLHVPDAVTQPVIRVTLNKNLYLLTLIVYWVTGKLNNTGTTRSGKFHSHFPVPVLRELSCQWKRNNWGLCNKTAAAAVWPLGPTRGLALKIMVPYLFYAR